MITKKIVKKTAKKVTKKTKVAKKKTYVAIVLDKSGSMDSLKAETVSSFNEQIKTIKKSAKGTETFVTLTLFNDGVEITKFAEPISKLKEIELNDYNPCGFTAIYDAIGMTVERMKKEIEDINDSNTAVLFIIITDGCENASKTWSALDIAGLVKGLTGTKRWTFSVLGANIDLAGLSENLGIAKNNMAKFTASSQGMMRGTTVTTNSIGNYFTKRLESNDLVTSSVSVDFYSAKPDEILDITDDSKNVK